MSLTPWKLSQLPVYSSRSRQLRKYKQRRVLRGRSRRRFRMPRQIGKGVHSFKRVSLTEITYVSTSGPDSYVKVFKLTDIPGYTEIKALYDMYKIVGVKFELMPSYNVATVSEAATAGTYGASVGLGYIASVIDYNDDTALANINEAAEYSTFRMSKLPRTYKRYFRPRAQVQIYETGLTTGYGLANKSMWFNTADDTIPHYALKVFMDPHLQDNVGDFTYFQKVTYYVLCKNVK